MNTEASTETHEPLPRKRRRRWLMPLVAVAIFASGGIVGAGASVLLIRRQVLHAIQHPEQAPVRITHFLRNRLDLSDGQAETVRNIIEDRQLQLQAIRKEAQPRVEEQLDLVHDEIAEVLDDSQKREWHDLYKSIRERWTPPFMERE